MTHSMCLLKNVEYSQMQHFIIVIQMSIFFVAHVNVMSSKHIIILGDVIEVTCNKNKNKIAYQIYICVPVRGVDMLAVVDAFLELYTHQLDWACHHLL